MQTKSLTFWLQHVSAAEKLSKGKSQGKHRVELSLLSCGLCVLSQTHRSFQMRNGTISDEEWDFPGRSEQQNLNFVLFKAIDGNLLGRLLLGFQSWPLD